MFPARHSAVGPLGAGFEPGGRTQPAARQSCSVAVWLLLQLEDPRVRLVSELGEEQQLVAAEALSGLPVVAVFVEALEGDVVAG